MWFCKIKIICFNFLWVIERLEGTIHDSKHRMYRRWCLFNSRPFLYSEHFLAAHNLKFSQRNDNKHYKQSLQTVNSNQKATLAARNSAILVILEMKTVTWKWMRYYVKQCNMSILIFKKLKNWLQVFSSCFFLRLWLHYSVQRRFHPVAQIF